MNLGIIGLNPDNGHPYSFSAILNGYSDEGFSQSGWDVIHAYLKAKDPTDFGYKGARVTHAWTQDPELTARLSAASRIPHAVAEPGDMIGKVDGVILARHDHENHWSMAKPFLDAGIPLLIDKPLTLDLAELRAFQPHIEAGRVMSLSALAMARETDAMRSRLAGFGRVKLIRGTVLLDWEKYGVHMVDAILSLTPARPVAVTALGGLHDSMALHMDDGGLVQIDALGGAPKVFRVEVFGSEGMGTVEIDDNFAAFRRLIGRFIDMIETGRPTIDPTLTSISIRVLITGRRSAATGHREPLVGLEL